MIKLFSKDLSVDRDHKFELEVDANHGGMGKVEKGGGSQ